MRIAVIGGGAAGLTTAWLLESDHEVTLYEKEDRLGGHAHTLNLEIGGKQVAVDGGFEFFSNVMFPTFMRLLKLLNVPISPFDMVVTQYRTGTGGAYLMPPLRNGHLFLESLTPRKISDLLRFQRLLKSSREIMDNRDTSVTLEEFVARLHLSDGFASRFVYPFFQAGWGVSLEEIKTFMVYNVLRYAYLNLPSGFAPGTWNEIDGGTQTYIKRLCDSLTTTRIKTGTGLKSLHRTDDVYQVEDSKGQIEVYDHVVLATNANQAAVAINGLPSTQDICRLLNEPTYFETTIAIHGDTRLMPPRRKHWSTVNIRFDGTYSQLTIWKPWKSQIPVFKSWITYDTRLPEPLYAIAKYHHARVDAAYFYAQKALQAYQGRDNLWLAGTYMHDVDCHESAVLSGVKVAQALAPNSARLKQLTSTA